MAKVTFIREPGHTSDLLALFTLHFNLEHFTSEVYKTGEKAAFIEKLCEEFAPFPAELYPFFHLTGDGVSFMSRYYNADVPQTTAYGDYRPDCIIAQLEDADQVIRSMLGHYFPALSADEAELCRTSVTAAGKQIKSSSYSDSVKSGLYAFFLEPEQTVRLLADSLAKKAEQLTKWRKKQETELKRLEREFDAETTVAKICQLDKNETGLAQKDTVYVSFALCTPAVVKLAVRENEMLLLLGSAYQETVDELNSAEMPTLDAFGNALAERSRVDILNLILKNGEVGIREIERALGFSGTNTYYHLSLMIRAGMLKTRSQGRKLMYSINHPYFTLIRDLLTQYE